MLVEPSIESGAAGLWNRMCAEVCRFAPGQGDDLMIEYRIKGRRMRSVFSLGLGGGLLTLITGVVTLYVWVNFLSGNYDWTVAKFLPINLGIVVPILILHRGCIQCIAIGADQDGLAIQTCFLFRFFVPWQYVGDPLDYDSFSPTAFRMVRDTFVEIEKGLTWLHRRPLSLAALLSHNWARGFVITSEAQGYAELRQAIEEHVSMRHRSSEP